MKRRIRPSLKRMTFTDKPDQIEDSFVSGVDVDPGPQEPGSNGVPLNQDWDDDDQKEKRTTH